MKAYSKNLIAWASTFVLLACSSGGGDSDTGDGDGDTTTSGGAAGDGDVASGSGGAGTDGTGGGTGAGGSGGPGSGGGGAGGTGTGGLGIGGTGTGGSGTGGGVAATGGSASGGHLFSTNFDSDPVGNVVFGGSTWTTTLPQEYDSAGIVAVVSDKAHSGSNSVYVKKGNDGQAFLQLTDAAVFPFAGSKIHVRAFINVPEWPANHVSWIEIGTPVNEEHELRVGAHQGVLQVNHWPGDQDQIAEGISFAVNEWHCIELSYDTSTSTIEVWLDDTKIDALTAAGTFARGGTPEGGFPPIEALRFGAEIQATEAWYDDIAVGTGPIGCN